MAGVRGEKVFQGVLVAVLKGVQSFSDGVALGVQSVSAGVALGVPSVSDGVALGVHRHAVLILFLNHSLAPGQVIGLGPVY